MKRRKRHLCTCWFCSPRERRLKYRRRKEQVALTEAMRYWAEQ